MDFPICLFMKYVLRDEYVTRSNILYNLSIHIDTLYTECFIYYAIRNKYISTLNNMIKKINDVYNSNIRSIKKFNIDSLSDKAIGDLADIINPHEKNVLHRMKSSNEVFDKMTIEKFKDDLYNNEKQTQIIGGVDEFVKIFYSMFKRNITAIKISNLFKTIKDVFKITSFSDIDKGIFNLASLIGFSNISDPLKLLICDDFRKVMMIDESVKDMNKFLSVFDKSAMRKIDAKQLESKIQNGYASFDLLNRAFVPVKVIIGDNDGGFGITVQRKIVSDPTLNENNHRFKYSVMLGNCYRVTVRTKIPNMALIYVGYFKNDTVNVDLRMSKVCVELSPNYFINAKLAVLQKYIEDKVTIIDEGFRSVYLKNLDSGDILSMMNKDLEKKMIDDYRNIYIRCSNTKFRTIMSDFLKSSINSKFNVLKILLMGNKDTTRYAGLLYALIKDQYINVNNSNSRISDILFRNLNYSLQCKLRKTGYYIRDEMDRLKSISSDDIDLKKQVITSITMPDNIKKYAINKINEMKNNNSEYSKYHQLVKCLIDYPWITKDSSDIFSGYQNNMKKCKKFLEKYDIHMKKLIYGHNKCKTRIKGLVAKWMVNPKSMGHAIGLYGKPGVGKTLIAQGIGKVLGIPYEKIDLGGKGDSALLSGHSLTYSTSQPGDIVKRMCEMGKSRCILFFDELDKTKKKDDRDDIQSTLIHLIDPTSDRIFSDNYFQGVKFPLSNVLFVFAFNDINKVSPILLDRMEVIHVDSYSPSEKITIAKDFLLDDVSKEYAFDRESIKIEDNAMKKLIDKYTNECGVRSLNRKLDIILSNMNLDRIYKTGIYKDTSKYNKKNKIIVTADMIDNYLDGKEIRVKKIHTEHTIGMLSGLYATDYGSGGIIPIIMVECYMNNPDTKLQISGNQGKVMKESVGYSYDIAMGSINDEYRNKFNERYKLGIRIHASDTATPKDGPSAGSAFTTAFLSIILGKHIKKDIAMTGEIEAFDNVIEIGGLEQKLIGAKKAGVKLVLCPKENMDDILKIKRIDGEFISIWNPEKDIDVKKELDELVKEGICNKQTDFRIMFVKSINEIIKYTFIDDVSKLGKYNTYKSYFNPHKYLSERITDKY